MIFVSFPSRRICSRKMKVSHARVHVANMHIIFSLFSLMTLHFDQTKFTTLIWEHSEYRLVFVGLFVCLIL